ncbi:DUF6766 family protein [Flavobacterium sp. CLA17]|uniref:DUF6766 family protein n=1 Tax=Flavobacterium sp. CLA17 TaxID=2724135 RepID=UPI0014930F75|nr:DUF6766 family protein [Flavobacterium sp. CLA17]QSB25483.1 hypothetical protein HAV12_013990 [Flavobacterium sp. CLA17]
MKTFLRNNGLSFCFFLLFVGAMAGQIIFGFEESDPASHISHFTSNIKSQHSAAFSKILYVFS